MTKTDEQQQLVAQRLEEAGLSTDRFTDVENGTKVSYESHSSPEAGHAPGEVDGNYGIYGGSGLVDVDVDDYDDEGDTSALDELPETFTIQSPHGGEHRYYHVEGDLEEAIEDEFNKTNLQPDWGEIRIKHQYVVGPGSQLDSCDKDWHDCSEEGEGYYEVYRDEPIATLSVEEFMEFLRADPSITKVTESVSVEDESDDETSDFMMQAMESVDRMDNETIKKRLAKAVDSNVNIGHAIKGNYSKIDEDGLDTSDRSDVETWLARQLGWWLDKDKAAVRWVFNNSDCEKWHERTDDSYRKSILKGVEHNKSYYGDDTGFISLGAGKHITRTEGGYKLVDKSDDETVESMLTDFIINVDKVIETEENSEQMEVTLVTDEGMEFEAVFDSSKSFSTARNLRESLPTSYTSVFTSQTIHVQKLKKMLTKQEFTRKQGISTIGIENGYFITPDQVVDGNGIVEDPDTVYYDKTLGVNNSGGPYSDLIDFDADFDVDITRQLQLLSEINHNDTLVPVVGWFFSSFVAPKARQSLGIFPILQIHGQPESGKTETMKLLARMAGYKQSEPIDAKNTTQHAFLRYLSDNNAFPVFFDEFKLDHFDSRDKKRIREYLHAVPTGSRVTKGQSNLSTVSWTLEAPVCIAGEDQFTRQALKDRSIPARFKQDVIHNEEYADAFDELYGMELSHIGPQFAKFIMGIDDETIEIKLKGSYEFLKEYISENYENNISIRKKKGAAILLCGISLFNNFAGAQVFGKHESVEAIAEALELNRDEEEFASPDDHVDEFVKVIGHAANRGQLTLKDDFYVKDGEIYIKMPQAYPVFRKTVREYDIGDSVERLSEQQYNMNFSEKEETDSYVLSSSKQLYFGGDYRGRFKHLDASKLREANIGVDGSNFSPEVKSVKGLDGECWYCGDDVEVEYKLPRYGGVSICQGCKNHLDSVK